MRTWLKWLAGVLAAGVLLLGAVVLVLQHWVRSDDFRLRVEKEAAAALGVPLQLGRLSVDLFPVPAVAADALRLQTRPALTLGRVEARPLWRPLLLGRLEIRTLVVREAVLPQAGIAALLATLQKREPGAAKTAQPAAAGKPLMLPHALVLDDITWIDEKGQRLTADARVEMGGDGLLDRATLKVKAGRFAGTHGEVKHEGGAWPLELALGGGHIRGRLQLQPGKAAGAQLLTGELSTQNVEVAALTAPAKPLTGKLQAQTTLRAEFREPGEIAQALQTSTRFTVRDAVVLGLDLEKAVQTVGLSRGGVTRLDTLAGQVSTQGKAVHATNLVATSGVLSATGQVAVSANRQLSGRVNVDVNARGNNYAVPLAVGGTLDAPSVSLSSAALAGAAVGAAAAGLGDRLRSFLGRK